MSAQPVWFGPTRRELFGWHHPALGPVRRRTVVVLCPPIGYDYMCAYRSWRILAERLSGTGFGVFRFDYLGTGDSAGSPEDRGQLRAWVDSIGLAVAEARRQTGAESVAVVGFRLGATLAATAAGSLGPIADLVLWDPFRTGKAYVREVRALAQLGHISDDEVGDDLSVAGFLVTGETAADLSGVDLGALTKPPSTRTLIIERDDRPADGRLSSHLRQLGGAVTSERLLGTSSCLVEPMTSVVPEVILNRVVGWLEQGHPGAPPEAAPPAPPATAAAAGLSERAIFFGEDRRLFGILTEPTLPRCGAPAIIVLNTGCEYHVGPHRMFVPLARRWAGLGHDVFRFDLGGIGDSDVPASVAPNVAYPSHALADIRRAIEAVTAQTGAERVILVGICAGGWHAFAAARHGLPIHGFIGVNPPLYIREGPQYGREDLRDEREVRRYAESLVSPEKWKKALTGKASARSFIGVTSRSLWRSLKRFAARLVRPANAEGLHADLCRIAERGVDALMVFSDTDLSQVYFELRAGDPAGESGNRIHARVLAEADHTFRPLLAQEKLRDLMDDFLKRLRTGVERPETKRLLAPR